MMYNPKSVFARAFGGKAATTPQTVRKVNVVLGVLLAAQAVAILLLSISYEVPVYVMHLTGDSLQTKLQGVPVVAPALYQLLRVNLSYVLAAMLLLTALAYILSATLLRVRYEAWLKKGIQPLRWVVIAVAGGLLVESLVALAGANELTTLKLVGVSMILAALAGAWLELQPARNKRDTAGVLAKIIAIVAALAPLATSVLTMLATNAFGSVATAGYLWWLFGTVVAGWVLIAGVLCLSLRKYGKWGSYMYAELWYLALIFAIETACAWQLYLAVLHP